ncbi:MAG: hypothetical protein IKY59_04250 [Oscillospiraceae bacterium]|nr:hypothetical protein [Oscillospiraceae bacterium]
MAYTICYYPDNRKRLRVRGIWTTLFFLLFLAVARIYFSDQLNTVYEYLFRDGIQTFLQEHWEVVAGNAN